MNIFNCFFCLLAFVFSATFEFPFLGVSKAQARPMKDTLESIVADILKVPERNVASVISSDLNHAHIDFFATKPSENARDLCESGKMPPKLWRALQKDPEISPLLENQKGNFNYF